MKDFEPIRKQRKGGNKHVHPMIGVGLPLGEFSFYEPTMDLLNIDKRTQALMFYVNKKDKKVKVKIETKDDDNYHLSGTKRSYSRFTSKPLGVVFADVFGFDMKSKHFFKLEKVSKIEFDMTLITND